MTKAARDFSHRPPCRSVMRMVAMRPTLALWINYYADGKRQNSFVAWWNEENVGNTQTYYNDVPEIPYGEFPAFGEPTTVTMTEQERLKPFGAVGDPEPVAPSSWDLAVSRRKSEENEYKPKTEPPRYGTKKKYSKSTYASQDLALDRPPEEETQDDFDRKIEMERQGIDQPDDFSASENKYSQSKYD